MGQMELSDAITRLTERQKEILRLLFNGHDAKSAASEFGISVHTVNEHLSEARKHLGVSSSRSAARLLAQSEASPPRIEGPDRLGVAVLPDDKPDAGSTRARKRFVLAGGFVMVLFSAAIIGFLFGHAGNSDEVAKAPPRVVSTMGCRHSLIAFASRQRRADETSPVTRGCRRRLCASRCLRRPMRPGALPIFTGDVVERAAE